MITKKYKTSNHELFKMLSSEEKELIEKNLINSTASPKEYLYKKENKLNHIYFISQGAVLIGKNYNKPNEFASQLFMNPVFLGVESIIFNGENRQFAKALSDVHYCKINKSLFLNLMKNNPRFHQVVQKQLAVSFRHVQEKYDFLVEKSSDERLRLFLQEIYEKNRSTVNKTNKIELHISHLEISKYLQCSRQTVTSGFNKMRAEGIIDYSRNWIEIIDLKS